MEQREIARRLGGPIQVEHAGPTSECETVRHCVDFTVKTLVS